MKRATRLKSLRAPMILTGVCFCADDTNRNRVPDNNDFNRNCASPAGHTRLALCIHRASPGAGVRDSQHTTFATSVRGGKNGVRREMIPLESPQPTRADKRLAVCVLPCATSENRRSLKKRFTSCAMGRIFPV